MRQITANHARAAVADKISVGPDASVREIGLILSFLFYFLFSVILASSFPLHLSDARQPGVFVCLLTTFTFSFSQRYVVIDDGMTHFIIHFAQ